MECKQSIFSASHNICIHIVFLVILLTVIGSYWYIFHILQGCFTGNRAIAWLFQNFSDVIMGVMASQIQHQDYLLNRLIRHRSQNTSKLHVTGLWAGNSPVTGEFPAQMASNAENVSIWWRHHAVEYKECIFSGLYCSLLVNYADTFAISSREGCFTSNRAIVWLFQCHLHNSLFYG